MSSNELTFSEQLADCFRSIILGILAHFRHFRHFVLSKYFRHSYQSGLAYVAILILLAVVSTLAMAFLFKAGTLTSATTSRLEAMRAEYLAETAANHALWRLLNDPGFPADESVYYMHDLTGGRYGYKVRRPTLTTFATVAAVGAAGAAEARQGFVQYIKPENVITAYEPYGGTIIPVFRRLLGATLTAETDAVNVGGNDSQYTVLKGCPIRTEVIMGTHDSAQDINFAVWDGSTWGNLTEFTQATGSLAISPFDIAYENQTGRALVVGRYNITRSVRYNIWNGTAWAFAVTPQEDAALLTGANITYLDMASKPNSNEILIAEVDDANDLKMVQWDGAAFHDLGEIDTDMGAVDYGSAEVVYEQQSGDALVLWSHKNSSQIYYRIWSGGSLSPANQQLPFDFGGTPNVIRAAADPTSDYIVVAAKDKFDDLNVAVWDGNAWIDSREIETSVYILDAGVFDVAWEHSGEDLVIAWAPFGSMNIRYFTWRKGTALADHAVQVGPDFQAIPQIVRLLPVSGSQKIILLCKNVSRHLRYCLWTGNAFLGNPPILVHSDLGLGNSTFDVAEPGVAYTGGSG